MASNPNDPSEAFNQLVDLARARGFRVGLQAGNQLHAAHNGEQWRDLVAIELKAKDHVLAEPIVGGDLQAAAGNLLRRLPAPA